MSGNSSDNEQCFCPIVADFDFGRAIEERYPLLSIVFSFLPTRDLRNASQINSVWKEYADRELSKRTECGTFEIYRNRTNFEWHKSSSFDYVNPSYGFIFGSVTLDRKPRLTLELIDLDVITFGFIFGSILPKKKKIVCKGILFPKIPNLVIEEYTRINFLSGVAGAFERGLKLKALLYFCDERSTSYERSLKLNLHYLLDKQNSSRFALAGGLISARMKDDKTFSRIRAQRGFQYGIAFFSPESENNFEAHSIVIENNEDYKEKLLETKHNVVLKKFCTAFLFQCSGLNVPYLEEEFRCHFPTVHLICVTVEGEIGWDTDSVSGMYNEDDVTSSKRSKNELVVLHAYSIVILFLCWD